MTPADCPLCRTVPDRCIPYSCGGTSDHPLPPAAGRFVVVGGPAMASADAIVRCPECGTLYRSESSTESVANGPSEDTTTLTRLDPAAGASAVADIEARLELRQRRFDTGSAEHLALLRAAPGDLRVLQKVAEFFVFQGVHQRYTQPLAPLLETLLTHAHQELLCPGGLLHTFLSRLVREDETRLDEFGAWVRGLDLATCPPEVEWLARQVNGELQQRKR